MKIVLESRRSSGTSACLRKMRTGLMIVGALPGGPVALGATRTMTSRGLAMASYLMAICLKVLTTIRANLEKKDLRWRLLLLHRLLWAPRVPHRAIVLKLLLLRYVPGRHVGRRTGGQEVCGYTCGRALHRGQLHYGGSSGMAALAGRRAEC